jgi:hypothetical protein
MAFREARPMALDAAQVAAAAPHPLMAWMSRHGNTALIVELSMLAVFTVGAIGTDDYWQRREAANRKREMPCK